MKREEIIEMLLEQKKELEQIKKTLDKLLHPAMEYNVTAESHLNYEERD